MGDWDQKLFLESLPGHQAWSTEPTVLIYISQGPLTTFTQQENDSGKVTFLRFPSWQEAKISLMPSLPDPQTHVFSTLSCYHILRSDYSVLSLP